MSQRLQSLKSRFAQIATKIRENYNGEVAVPIGFEDLQALKGAIRRAMQERHGPKDSAYLELADELVGHFIDRRKELSNPPKERVLQFKVILTNNPDAWRRIQVEDEALRDFRDQLMALGDWTYEESFGLQIGTNYYVHADSVESEDLNIEAVGLCEALGDARPLATFELMRDYNVWLDLVFEGCCDREPSQKYPRCLEGAGSFPPEEAMEELVAANEKQAAEPVAAATHTPTAHPAVDTVATVIQPPFNADAATAAMQD